MAYKLIVSRTANEELERIIRYMVDQLRNPKAATDFVDLVEEKYRYIAENPRMYPLSRQIRLRSKGYRLVSAKNFLILYRIAEEQQEVHISGIFYEGEDYQKKLFYSSEE